MKRYLVVIFLVCMLLPAGAIMAQESDDSPADNTTNNTTINNQNEKLNQQLWGAAYVGDMVMVRQVLNEGADINYHGERAWTPLMIASTMGHYDVAQELLISGADVNFYDGESIAPTPLAIAVLLGHSQIVKLLLSFGADIDKKNNRESSPLNLWFGSHFFGRDDERHDILQLLLTCANKANKRSQFGHMLIGAVQQADATAVKILLDNGADINTVTEEGMSAYDYAILDNQLEIIKLLHNAGAIEHKIKLSDKSMPLPSSRQALNNALLTTLKNGYQYLSEMGDMSSRPSLIIGQVNALIRAGANVNIHDEDGTPLLMQAVTERLLPTEVIKLLIDAGAKVDVKHEDESLLGAAAQVRAYNPNLISLLIRSGANVNDLDKEGYPVLISFIKHFDGSDDFSITMASFYNCTAIISSLCDGGADVNACDEEGRTALMYAIDLEQDFGAPLVKVLLECGADINIKDKDGKSVREYIDEQQTPIIARIIKAQANN